MKQGDIALLLETKLQTMGYFLSGNLEPEEINLSLDQSTNDFIDEVFSGLRKPEINGGSFESNSVRLDELRTLKKTSDEISKTGTPPSDQSWFALPDDYRDYIRIRAKVTADCFENPQYKKSRVLESETIDELLDDTHHQSTHNSPVAEIENTNVIIHLNDFTVAKIKIVYIKKPPEFDIVGEKDTEYPLPNKSIYRIIDKVSVMLAPVLEKLQQQMQSVQSTKLS